MEINYKAIFICYCLKYFRKIFRHKNMEACSMTWFFFVFYEIIKLIIIFAREIL